MNQKSAFEIPRNYKIIKVAMERAQLKKVYDDPQIEHNNEKVLDYLTKDYQGAAQFFDIDFDNGKALVSWGVQRGSQEAEVYNKKGLLAAKEKNFTDAIDLWRKAHYINNMDPDTLYNLALAYFEIGNHTKALDKCLEVIANCPVYFRAYFLLGSIYSKMRKFDLAATTLNKGLIFQPDNVTALVNLGAIASILRDNQEAIQAFEKAIAISPKEIKAYLGLGKVYAMQNDVENANRCFKLVIKLDPNGKLGDIARNSILPEKELALVLNDEHDEQTFNDIKDAAELYSHGFKLFLNCDYGNAAQLLSRYVHDKAKDFKAWSILAICQLRAGDKDKSILSIEKALALQTRNAALYKQASILYDAVGLATESAEAAIKARELGKDDSVTLALLGIGKAFQGALQESVRILQDAVNKNPNNLKARFHLAKVLNDLEQKDAARQHLEEILWTERQTPLKQKAKDLLQQIV
ncbi:tetratricopeptide repeat protein [candidate division KSB1 bacterium]|nr:tetratricopeptide repeat protein [candidate division KSB1 bacterium]RQW07876.1 MAG: tetratricopeptide repeat protein [candidate division KSB1 bacterium]